MSDINKTAKKLHEVIKEASKEKKNGYDTPATVARIEDGYAWVHIPGGVEETPAKLTINAKVGDVVQVRVSGGRATLTGNASAPPTDNTAAYNAMNQASTAAKAAAIAQEKAEEAIYDASRARDAADQAEASAASAAEDAAQARADAGSARESAESANESANSALRGLSFVEDVVGTLDWIREHGSYVATEDTTVRDGQIYFEFINGEYVPITNPDPEANPSAEGWYVLDLSDSQSQFIMAHLAVTNRGLWILPNRGIYPLTDENGNNITDESGVPLYAQISEGYKALLSNEGMTIYDSSNNVLAVYSTAITLGKQNGWRVLVTPGDEDYTAGVHLIAPDGTIAQSTTANGISFNTGIPVTIGDSTASIAFDGNGHINMTGADITIGGSGNYGSLNILSAGGDSIGRWDNTGITAESGSIGGWDIDNDALISELNIPGLDGIFAIRSYDNIAQEYSSDIPNAPLLEGVISLQGTPEYESVKLTVIGEMYLQGSKVLTSANNASDIRLKENVKDTTVNALEVVRKIKMREFDWKDNRQHKHSPIGVIADEIEDIDPILVNGGGYRKDGAPEYKYINTLHLANYLTKAVQELDESNNKAKRQITDLENRISKLEERLDRLEAK